MEKPTPVPQESRIVLIVEDEVMTRRMYVTGLKGLQAQGWSILAAENGAVAAELLRHEPVDVVVTDLNMPVMDGYRLITYIHDHDPTLPIIVLTSLPSGEPQEKALRLGAMRVMSKPARLSLLMDEIRQAGEHQPDGVVRGLGLSSLLQLMTWEGKTCTLKVRSGRDQGFLYLKAGALIHAEHATSDGLIAAYDILGWPTPSVEFVEACRVDPTIDLPISEILMNVALIQDNQQRNQPDTTVQNPRPNDPWTLVDRP